MNSNSLTGYYDLLSYYQNLGIINHEEFEDFKKSLLEELPITFRINKAKKYYDVVEKRLIKIGEDIAKETGKAVLIKKKILQEEIFEINLPVKVLKKEPLNKELNNFLNEETNMSHILRQEAVSMIPVSLLDISHKDRVLDMCAAPGSKTLQILEKMVDSQNKSGDKDISGYIVANELDSQRANMLAFQSLKIRQNCLLITNQNACTLPETVKFDKVLCDVPCSGDGTIRKNEMIKKGWSYKYGLKLHIQQLNLLIKGLNLLEQNGLLVYSTCAMNPIEDEAVVNAALNLFGKSVELVDITKSFQEFKVAPGVNKWKVYLKRGKKELNQDWFSNFAQVLEMKKENKILATMFPNEASDSQNPLHYTARVWPHHNNTGGFYIALFRKLDTKTCPLYEEPQQEDVNPKEAEKLELHAVDIKEDEKNPNNNEEEKSSEKEPQISGNKLLKFCDAYPEQWDAITSFYGLDQPGLKDDLYLLNGYQKRILNVNKGLAKFMETAANEKIRIVSLGIKFFEKLRDDECTTQYRVLYEALDTIIDHVKNQIIEISPQEFSQLIEDFEKNISLLDASKFKYGPFIVSTEKYKDLSLIAWKGRKRITLLIGKEEIHYLKYLMKYICLAD